MYTAKAEAISDALEVVPEEVLGTLARLVRELRFGSIEIVVHEGRITQIEKREKVRFAPLGNARST
ncbi:MAG TPA: YezD family protein [Burkholderiales bacterium]|nr:YezD family protein [Burkholderiales bacterium]